MKNCFDCKFKEWKYTGFLRGEEKEKFEAEKKTYKLIRKNVGISGDYYVRCGAGHTSKCAAFSKKHGKESRTSLEKRTDLDMDCFVTPEHIVVLDKIIAKTDELIALFKKK